MGSFISSAKSSFTSLCCALPYCSSIMPGVSCGPSVNWLEAIFVILIPLILLYAVHMGDIGKALIASGLSIAVVFALFYRSCKSADAKTKLVRAFVVSLPVIILWGFVAVSSMYPMPTISVLARLAESPLAGLVAGLVSYGIYSRTLASTC